MNWKLKCLAFHVLARMPGSAVVYRCLQRNSDYAQLFRDYGLVAVEERTFLPPDNHEQLRGLSLAAPSGAARPSTWRRSTAVSCAP